MYDMMLETNYLFENIKRKLDRSDISVPSKARTADPQRENYESIEQASTNNLEKCGHLDIEKSRSDATLVDHVAYTSDAYSIFSDEKIANAYQRLEELLKREKDVQDENRYLKEAILWLRQQYQHYSEQIADLDLVVTALQEQYIDEMEAHRKLKLQLENYQQQQAYNSVENYQLGVDERTQTEDAHRWSFTTYLIDKLQYGTFFPFEPYDDKVYAEIDAVENLYNYQLVHALQRRNLTSYQRNLVDYYVRK